MSYTYDIRVNVDTGQIKSGEREVQNFQKSMENTRQSTGKLADAGSADFTRFAGAAKVGLAAIATAAAATFAIVSAELVKINELNDLSLATGRLASEFAELQGLAIVAGADFNKLTGSLQRLTKQASEAIAGNKGAAETFAELGIDVQKFANSRAVDQINLINQAMGKFTNATERASVQQRLLGRDAVDFYKIAEAGEAGLEQAKRQGLVATEEQLRLSAELDAVTVELQASYESLKRALVDAFGPTVVTLVKTFSEAIKGLSTVVGGLTREFKEAGKANIELSEAGLRRRIGDLEIARSAREFEIGQLGIDPVTDSQLQLIGREIEKINNLIRQNAELARFKFNPTVADLEAAGALKPEKPVDQPGGKSSPAFTVTRKFTENDFGFLTPDQVRANTVDLIAAYNQRQEQIRKQATEFAVSLAESNVEILRGELRQITIDIEEYLNPGVRLETQFADDEEKIKSYYATLIANQNTYNMLQEALGTEMRDNANYSEMLNQSLEKLSDVRRIEQTKSAFEKLGITLEGTASQFADTLLRGIETGKFEFRQFIADVARQIAQVALTKAITNLVVSAFGAQANGAAFSGPVTPFAKGGIVGTPTKFFAAGGVGLMGEAGPEAIMPLKRGSDGKLGVAAQMSGGGSQYVINNYVTVEGGDDPNATAEATTKALNELMDRKIKQVLADQRRPGNSMNPTIEMY